MINACTTFKSNNFYDEYGSLIQISSANIQRTEIYYFCKFLSLKIPAINYVTRNWICRHKKVKQKLLCCKKKPDEHVLETLQTFLINESINLLMNQVYLERLTHR